MSPARTASSMPLRRRGLFSLAVLASLVAFASAAHVAQATKYFDSFFGGTGATGGLFSTSSSGVGDVAVNDPSVDDGNGGAFDGWVYVVDRGGNRIQAFDSDYSFQWAIGRDVSGVNEQQRVTVDATGGSYTLTFDPGTTAPETTDPIAFNASASSGTSSVQTRLRALPSIGATGVSVSGSSSGPRTITFTGPLAGTDVAELTADTTGLTGGGMAVTVETLVEGAGGSFTGFEKCSVAAECKSGTTGSLGGEFNVAQGVDVDQATGHFFVRERSNNRRVQEFTADGDFVRAWGWDVVQEATTDDTPGDGFETCFAQADCQGAPAGTELGQFASSGSNSSGIAVAPPGSPTAGDVYVADPGSTNSSDSAAGRRVLQFDVPANPASPVVAVAAIGDAALFGPLAGLGDDNPRHIAVDSNGILYAPADGSVVGVVRYDTASGEFLTAISSSVLGVSGFSVTGLEVDQAADRLFVGRPNAFGGNSLGVAEFDVAGVPAEVDSSRLVDVHGHGVDIAPNGLGLNPASGELFIPTTTAPAAMGTGSRVLVWDDDGVDPPPDVDPLPPSDVECDSATLRVEINPNGPTGFPTSYRFELSKDGISWEAVTADASAGDGGVAVSLDDSVSGLEGNTVYRVRVIATRSPSAGLVRSSELVFQTDPCAPVVETVGSQHVTDTTAQLVGRLNPGGLSTTYWFEWGNDSYGNRVPVTPGVAGGGGTLRVVEALSGLEPERFYHFRLCAQNSLVASKVCGADRVVGTRSAPISGSERRAFELITSPFKTLRRGGERGDFEGNDYSRFQGVTPSVDGGSAMWKVFPGGIDPDAGHGFTWADPTEVRERTATGWHGDATLKVAPTTTVGSGTGNTEALSADLRTQVLGLTSLSLFSTGGSTGIGVMGDNGGPLGAGWYPTVHPDWMEPADVASYNQPVPTVLDDRGKLAVAGTASGAGGFRDLSPVDGGGPAESLDPPQVDGGALVRFDAPDWRPTDLINECTGSVGGGTATELPIRHDAGTPVGPPFSVWNVTVTAGSDVVAVNFEQQAEFGSQGPFGAGQVIIPFDVGENFPPETTIEAVGSGTFTASANATASGTGTLGAQSNPAAANDDVVGTRSCEEGSPVHVRGATLPPVGADNDLDGSRMGIFSDDGSRFFFSSPDEGAPSLCSDATGADSDCPRQLFARSYDAAGEASVDWISRPEPALFDPADPDQGRQAIGLMGNGAAFEAASTDGRVVYFRSNAPLTSDDPNATCGAPCTEGGASPISWDLYRYVFPTDTGADPGDGTLKRVSGGPTATGTGTLTSGSPTVADVDVDSGAFVVGQIVSGSGIPGGTTVTAAAAGTLTLSQNASASGADVALSAAADPNTNCRVADSSCGGLFASDTRNVRGGALRFLSDDGDRAYFVTSASIPGAVNAPPAGGATTPTATDARTSATERNLYLYDASKDGAAAHEFIARIPFALGSGQDGPLDSCASSRTSIVDGVHDVPGAGAVGIRISGSCVKGTASGDAIVFETTGRLTSDDTDTAGDVYLYDATEDSLTRLSAPPAGVTPYTCATKEANAPETFCNGDLGFRGGYNSGDPVNGGHFGLGAARHYNLAQDEQGRLEAVVFESRLPLAEGAADNAAMKVYEWRRDGGRLALVSPAGSADSAFYTGMSRDGEDVYFWTEQRIDPREIDEDDGDVFDARIGGGFPPPPAPPALCDVLGDGCQSGGVGATTPPRSETTTSSSPDGNARAGDRMTLSLRKLSRSQRRRAARSGVLTLRVRTSRAGVLRLAVRAKIGKRTRRIGKTSKRVSKPGTAVARIRLNRAARKQLRSRRRLNVAIRVRAPGAIPKSMKVALRRAGK